MIRELTYALTKNASVWTGCLSVTVFSNRRTLLVLAEFVMLFTDYWLTDPRLQLHGWSKQIQKKEIEMPVQPDFSWPAIRMIHLKSDV